MNQAMDKAEAKGGLQIRRLNLSGLQIRKSRLKSRQSRQSYTASLAKRNLWLK